ncbi:MAG: DUF2304 family protein [Patescibacteria group bacterium]
MIVLQIIITLFVLLALIKTIRPRSDQKTLATGRWAWLILWLAVLVVFWLPDSTTYLANILGIKRGADLVIYLSVVVIFYLLFRVFIRLDKLESNLTKVVRDEAIKNVKNGRSR